MFILVSLINLVSLIEGFDPTALTATLIMNYQHSRSIIPPFFCD
jgi:hypothetical protein